MAKRHRIKILHICGLILASFGIGRIIVALIKLGGVAFFTSPMLSVGIASLALGLQFWDKGEGLKGWEPSRRIETRR